MLHRDVKKGAISEKKYQKRYEKVPDILLLEHVVRSNRHLLVSSVIKSQYYILYFRTKKATIINFLFIAALIFSYLYRMTDTFIYNEIFNNNTSVYSVTVFSYSSNM